MEIVIIVVIVRIELDVVVTIDWLLEIHFVDCMALKFTKVPTVSRYLSSQPLMHLTDSITKANTQHLRALCLNTI